MLYTQTLVDDGTTTVTTTHFAVDIPGPPVQLVSRVNGEQVMALTMTLRSGFPK